MGGRARCSRASSRVRAESLPEVRTLLAWAEDAGIAIGDDASNATASGPPTAPPEATATPETGISGPTRKATPDDCLLAISIKGVAPAAAVADAVAAPPGSIQPILDQLEIDGLVGPVAGAYRLTEAGTARAADRRRAERDAWGIDRAVAALDAFLDLDHRVKATVTDWQLRDVAAQVINDHTDVAYDAAVIERLQAVHGDATAWLAPVAEGCPRLGTYGVRLDRAIEGAVAGDGRYVASPRVDSYHGIWFELHEDLIQLAGLTRENEAAAGRA